MANISRASFWCNDMEGKRNRVRQAKPMLGKNKTVIGGKLKAGWDDAFLLFLGIGGVAAHHLGAGVKIGY